jgi:hypothetical protein
MVVIGIAGKKRSGKDTTAKTLIECAQQEHITATRRALADPVKEECASMLAPFMHPLKSYSEIVAEMHADETKEKYRPLLQFWGMFRRESNQLYWIDKLRAWILRNCREEREIVVVPDVRFPNEVEMVKQLGGVVVNVTRPFLDTGDHHVSEVALEEFKDWDYVVNNNSDLEGLEWEARRIFLLIKDWAWGGPK